MATSPTRSPAATGLRRIALHDELGQFLGVFTSHRGDWRIGDWVLMHEGRRLQIVGVLPATETDRDNGVESVWLVESA